MLTDGKQFLGDWKRKGILLLKICYLDSAPESSNLKLTAVKLNKFINKTEGIFLQESS